MNTATPIDPELTLKEQRCIALAAVFQAATLVTDLAQKGQCDPVAYQALIDTLFVFEPKDSLAVYGNNTLNLKMGLTQLERLSSQSGSKHFGSTAKYALSLLALQKQASKDNTMLETVHNRLTHMQYRQQHFTEAHDGIDMALAASLSSLYQDTLSQLKFRIQVQGNMENLTNTQISDRIRALLFAGFRSAMLWRQLGGSKWQLIFGRGDIERISKKLLINPIYPRSH